ncbi:MAG: SDR family NAD(P)-dependent oxidoreductase [Desulfurococcaceae archaeon]|jgi:UDP-glucose 4-epimerase|nr:SDR family NAD(P)-dependent oxidoreductase [Desulfurococcaceae archaeon]
MSIVVTGGAGFIGSHLVDKLVELGFSVKVLDNLSSGSLENIKHLLARKNIEFIHIDIKNYEELKKALRNVETIFHFAANPEVRVSTINPEVHFKENIVATFNVLEASRTSEVREIVFASSSSVYGEADNIPVPEEAPVKPVSVYGASKASCENLLHAYSVLYGLKTLVLRYANIVGPRLRHGIIYDLLIKLTRNRSELEVLGDGEQIRSYLHVRDAINATLIAWKYIKERYMVLNIGNKDWISVKDVVNIVLRETGLRGIKVIYKPILHGIGWLGDVKRIALDVKRIESLGWKPTMSSENAVADTVRCLIKELNLKFT